MLLGVKSFYSCCLPLVSFLCLYRVLSDVRVASHQSPGQGWARRKTKTSALAFLAQTDVLDYRLPPPTECHSRGLLNHACCIKKKKKIPYLSSASASNDIKFFICCISATPACFSSAAYLPHLTSSLAFMTNEEVSLTQPTQLLGDGQPIIY